MWRHNSSTDQIDVRWFQERCEFCNSKLVAISIPDRWPLDRALLKEEHELRVNSVSGIDDNYVENLEICSDFHVEDVQFRLCAACGWWCIVQGIHYETCRPFITFNWAAGCLRNEQASLSAIAVKEMRQALCACYERRWSIEPRQMEDIVASVFKSSGCQTRISKQSHDGGIDVFGIDQAGSPFGVQVKRHQNKIRIEEIRSFLGALLLHGIAQGVFVTTSTFTSGASRLQQQARFAGIRLECIDAQHLFEMIKAAQVSDFNLAVAPELAEEYARQISSLHFGYCSHLGSH